MKSKASQQNKFTSFYSVTVSFSVVRVQHPGGRWWLNRWLAFKSTWCSSYPSYIRISILGLISVPVNECRCSCSEWTWSVYPREQKLVYLTMNLLFPSVTQPRIWYILIHSSKIFQSQRSGVSAEYLDVITSHSHCPKWYHKGKDTPTHTAFNTRQYARKRTNK